ncbi:MAG: hypothetical protein H6R02_2015, partial [Burkholderiaceae bacterium]|nr:hypothetical protein [Burkholderiaceae bacterium]
MKQFSNSKRLAATLLGVAIGLPLASPTSAQTIIDEWNDVKAPAAPALQPVKVEPKETALLMLDFVKQLCGPRPRCVASLPKVQGLLTKAREAGVLVVYSLAGQ